MRSAWGAAALLFVSAAPAAAADISGEAAIVSDYRYRGLTLSDGRAALQGEVTVEAEAGPYATGWASTLGHGADSEFALTAGYAAELSQALSIDVSGTYFLYPSDGEANYFEPAAVVTAMRGPAIASLGANYVPPQDATAGDTGEPRGNLYLFVQGQVEVPSSPLTVHARVGRERGAFAEVERGAKWDWEIGVAIAASAARVGLAYVGSNAGGDTMVGSLALTW